MIEYHNELGAVLTARLADAQNRIGQFSREELSALAQQELVEREWLLAAVEPLVFDFDAISRPEEERAKQVKRPGQFGYDMIVDVTDWTFAIPFTGDRILVDHRPIGPATGGGHSHGGRLDNAQARDGFVELHVETTGLNPDDVRLQINGRIDAAKKWLSQQAEWANNYIRVWEPIARDALLSAVVRRQAHLDSAATVSDALAIPLSKAKHPIPVSRRPAPLKVARIAAENRRDPEYVLEDVIYADIIATIRAMGEAAERLPVTNEKLGEEDLRNVILFVLNANFEGSVAGEAFNGRGKTDIFLNWQGRAAFVGECKIWHGQSKFVEALEQLFGYTTWRDTLAALVIFAPSRTLTDVQGKARAAIEEHASFQRKVDEDRYSLTHPEDSAKRLTVSLLFVAATLNDTG